MLSEHTIVTKDEYYNNDTTYIDETGTLPHMENSTSIPFLSIPTKAQSMQTRRRNKNKKSRSIHRIIRRMEKAKYDAKHPHKIKPFAPPSSQPDPKLYGKHLEQSNFMQSRPELCCAALINSRERTFSLKSLRKRSDSDCSIFSSEEDLLINDNNANTNMKQNYIVKVTSPLYKRKLKQSAVRHADGTVTTKQSLNHEKDYYKSHMKKRNGDVGKYDMKLSPRNASLRHGIKHLPKKPLTVPRRHINKKTLNHKEEAKPFTWIYPTDEKFNLKRYKELYFHYQDWKKPGWLSHRRYIPNPKPFSGPGVVVNVTVNSGLPPGQFDLRRYEKLYLKKLAEEKRKLGFLKRKGKFWQKVDKSPVFSKNRKKVAKEGLTLSKSNAIEKNKRDEKKNRVKNRLRSRSMSKKLNALKLNISRENSGASASNSPQTSPKGANINTNVFDNVDAEITTNDMMSIFTPKNNNQKKKIVQDELDLSLMERSV